ncbi:MAG: M12 family metallo-peptidase [Hyphomicrobium sp.]|jgi:hypothetical protein
MHTNFKAALLAASILLLTAVNAAPQSPPEESRSTVGLVLSGLPPVNSPDYAALKARAAAKQGQALEMTQSEIWVVPADNVAAVTEAAEKLGVKVMGLDIGSSQPAFQPMPPSTPMSPAQKTMMHDTMQQKAVMGMSMMALPDPRAMEYALTQGMNDPDAPAEAAILSFKLRDDLVVDAKRTSVVKTKNGYAWHGTVIATGEPVTLLWWPEGRLSGSIAYKGHVYAVRSFGGGMHGIVEQAPNLLPPEHEPLTEKLRKKMNMTVDPLVREGDASTMMPRQTPPAIEAAPSLRPSLGEDRTARDVGPDDQTIAALNPTMIVPPPIATDAKTPETVITVLVAYTQAATKFYNDLEYDLIAIALEDVNQSFRNSGLHNIRVELAHAYETNYVESGSHFDHVFRFAYRNDGYMDEVHALRDEHKADVSILIVNDPKGCGLAAQVRAPQDRAFAVVDQACAATSYSLAHEIGHIIGARHDFGIDDSTAPFPFGHGYVNGEEWRTMMAYKESCHGCPRIPAWSSPGIKVEGIAAGDERSNNARVVAEEAARVAAFR